MGRSLTLAAVALLAVLGCPSRVAEASGVRRLVPFAVSDSIRAVAYLSVLPTGAADSTILYSEVAGQAAQSRRHAFPASASTVFLTLMTGAVEGQDYAGRVCAASVKVRGGQRYETALPDRQCRDWTFRVPVQLPPPPGFDSLTVAWRDATMLLRHDGTLAVLVGLKRHTDTARVVRYATDELPRQVCPMVLTGDGRYIAPRRFGDCYDAWRRTFGTGVSAAEQEAADYVMACVEWHIPDGGELEIINSPCDSYVEG